MSFENSRRKGKVWDDVKTLDNLIKNHNFNITAKSERELEVSFATAIMTMKDYFNGKIYSQIDGDGFK